MQGSSPPGPRNKNKNLKWVRHEILKQHKRSSNVMTKSAQTAFHDDKRPQGDYMWVSVTYDSLFKPKSEIWIGLPLPQRHIDSLVGSDL